MKRITMVAYVLLFMKIQLQVYDSSYFFLLTNLLGAALLWWEFKDSRTRMFSSSLIVYILVTFLLLGLRLFELEITAIALSSMHAFILSILLLAGHFYSFYFPILSFATLVKESKDDFFIKVVAGLAALLLLTFFFLPVLTPVFIAAIIVLNLVSLFLVKVSVPVEIEG